MKLSGVKTIIQISGVTDLEAEMLKASGFQDSGRKDSCGNEFWEHKLGIPMETDVFRQIGELIFLGSNGKIFLKLDDGTYTDRQQNLYRMENEKLIMIKDEVSSEMEYEVTDSECHDQDGKENAYWDHEVRLEDDRFILVRNYVNTGLIYVVKNEDGSTVYDYMGNCHPDFDYSEEEVLRFVKHYYEKNEAGNESDL